MENQIALFWDFENIHASVMAHRFGQSWYNNFKYKAMPNVVDIKSIVNYASSLGDLVLNRAYANWQWLGKYANDLNENAIELIQLFPRGRNSKNSADILLSIDIIEYLNLLPAIDTVILVSGDGDFIPVGKRVRRQGKLIIGVGVRETSNDFWIKTCNEFKYYRNLTSRPWTKDAQKGAPIQSTAQDIDLDEARALLLQAIHQLSKNRGEDWVAQVRIKPAMVRLDPSFDEQTYGFNSFGSFIRAQNDILNYRHEQGKQEPEYSIKESAVVDQIGDLQAAQPTNNENGRYGQYMNILAQQKIRLPSPEVLQAGIDIYGKMVAERYTFKDNPELDQKCFQELQAVVKNATETDARKLRHLFYKCFIFKKDEDAGHFSFHEDVTTKEEVQYRLLKLLIKRIGDNVDGELDTEALSRILAGDEETYKARFDLVMQEEEEE
jgi:uncharacterized LabA/DUF88 family protein